MAAGLGFKDFVTGEVLTAADVDGYLMQGVWVFADAAARDAAVTSPQEGNFAYLKDTNVTTYYTGSAWANLDTTGMTNPMTTTGDTIYSSSGSTPARLGIGTAGQILRVNSGATAPEWATPSTGGDTWSLVNAGGTSLTGATTVTVSGISDAEKLMILISGASSVSANANFRVLVNTDSGTNYIYFGGRHKAGNTYNVNDIVEQNGSTTKTGIEIGDMSNNTGSIVSGYVFFGGGCKATTPKVFTSGGSGNANGSSDQKAFYSGGLYVGTSAITSVSAFSTSGNFDAGTIFVYKA